MKKPVLAEKDYMRTEEAVQFYGLSRRKLKRVLDEEHHDFVAFYGKRKLILRQQFERYLEGPGIMEGLRNGKKRF